MVLQELLPILKESLSIPSQTTCTHDSNNMIIDPVEHIINQILLHQLQV